MVLIIDNYDSFTYNLVQYIGVINSDIKVIKNNDFSIKEIASLNPDRIIISPGPGTPLQSGLSVDIIKKFSNIVPILGICLGHQAISIAFGGDVEYANQVVHGKTCEISHFGSMIFDSVPNKFIVTRYHSLVIKKDVLPNKLRVTALSNDGLIMAIEHSVFPLYGVQFHPESVMTEYGKKIIENFIKYEHINAS
tara:strand:+ start:1778 stop:2359 length:582 start_codon:yes stop_codon:yes gene_type:complete